jgi:photosystem II stability/assembly factor-like uncharacterized protein
MGRCVALLLMIVVPGAISTARAQDAGVPAEGDAPWWDRNREPQDPPPPQPFDPDSAPPPTPGASPGTIAPPPHATWQWRRVFSHPRIGSRLTAIGVDPNDPDRVIAGSEEGTVFQSFDGGATWDERPLYPFINIDRSLGLQSPGLPALGGFIPSTLQTILVAPFNRLVGIPTVPYAGYDPTFGRSFEGPQRTVEFATVGGVEVTGGPVFPEFFATFFITPGFEQPNILASVTRSRRAETQPVRSIQFCEGNDFPLIVATARNLYGSADGGLTYVRLFAVAGTVQLRWVACSRDDPNHVALATSFGLYRSQDGGLTFDIDTSGWPGAGVENVAYGEGGKLFAANGSLLFRSEPRGSNVMVYPDFENNTTAPWTTIRWIEVTEQQIWLATDDGIRGSLDGGDGWNVPARLLFSRQKIPQVIVGKNEVGGDRVAVMIGPGPAGVQGAIWASDDGGDSWFPFFHGVTRRSLTMMAAARTAEGNTPRWYVASGHEVWATAEPGETNLPHAFGGDPDLANWARRELVRQPSLAILLEEVYAHNEIGPEEVREFTDGLSTRAWVPRLDVVFELQPTDLVWAAGLTPPTDFGRGPVDSITIPETTTVWQLYIQGTWYLYDAVLANQEWDAFQNQVHEVRRQIAFAVEDSWRERTQHLRRIAGGRLDSYQAAVLRMRIETIDAALEVWTGRPLSELSRRRTIQ